MSMHTAAPAERRIKPFFRKTFLIPACLWTAVVVTQPVNAAVSKIGIWPGEPGGDVSRIVVQDGYAYCATGRRGLAVLDVRDPIGVRKIGSTVESGNSFINRLIVSGRNVHCVRDDFNYEVYSVENPAAPQRLHQGYVACLCEQRITGLAGQGNLVFRAINSYAVNGAKHAALHVNDFSTSTAPVGSSVFEFGGEGGPVASAGGFVFWYIHASQGICGSDDLALLVIETGDPTALRAAGRTAPGSLEPGIAQDIKIDGQYALCLSYHQRCTAPESAAVDVVEVSDPAVPRRVGGLSWASWPPSISFGLGHGLAIKGNLAFVADGLHGLRVIDYSIPTTPIQIALLQTGGIARDVYLSGNHAYVANGDRGVVIFDVSALSNPRLLAPDIGADRTFRFSLAGPTNQVVRIQTSTNLIDWRDWKTFTMENAPLTVSDPDSASAAGRFYRTVSP